MKFFHQCQTIAKNILDRVRAYDLRIRSLLVENKTANNKIVTRF